jgi:N-acetylmuramoyl-L-alanine amidase
MLWISRPRVVGTAVLMGSTVVLISALLLSGAAPEKHLSIYSVAANYSVAISEREGHDYVRLLEVLDPLGKVSAKLESPRWRLRYNGVQGEFFVGKTHARIQGFDADLGARFLLDNRHGLVPVSALASLLPRILGGPVTLHQESSRLFIGNVATHFTASLSSDNPARLVFHFSAPVNPTVATEPGALRLTFAREPVVAPASPTLTFGSQAIPSANYSESNGAALVTVNTTIPVMASFSNDGRTVTVSGTSSPVAATAQNATPASPPVAAPRAVAPTQPGSPANPATAGAAPAARHYFAVVDASHGGSDLGETLSPTLFEKDITVALARSLRQELESRGITTLVLGDSDANLATDQRAVLVNADRAAIYIAWHAASSGHGVRVYSALLPVGGDDRGPFRSWTTAQRSSLSLSQTTATAVAAEIQKRQIPVRSLAAALRPLNLVAGVAIAVEIAPQGSDVNQLTAPDYQQLVTSAVATAIAASRDQLGAGP